MVMIHHKSEYALALFFLLFVVSHSANAFYISADISQISRDIEVEGVRVDEEEEAPESLSRILTIGLDLPGPKKGRILQLQYRVESTDGTENNSSGGDEFLRKGSLQFLKTFRPPSDDEGYSWNFLFGLSYLDYRRIPFLEASDRYAGFELEGAVSIPVVREFIYLRGSIGYEGFVGSDDAPDLTGLTADAGLFVLLDARYFALGIKGGYRGRAFTAEETDFQDIRHGPYASIAAYF